MKIKQLFFIILLLFLVLHLVVGCINKETEIECENLSPEECLNYGDDCELCPERVISNYAGCHTPEFCKNVSLG